MLQRFGPLMNRGGAAVSLTYLASERIVPGAAWAASERELWAGAALCLPRRALLSGHVRLGHHLLRQGCMLVHASCCHRCVRAPEQPPCIAPRQLDSARVAGRVRRGHEQRKGGARERHARACVRGGPQVGRARQHHLRGPARLARRQGHRLHRRHDPARSCLGAVGPVLGVAHEAALWAGMLGACADMGAPGARGTLAGSRAAGAAAVPARARPGAGPAGARTRAGYAPRREARARGSWARPGRRGCGPH